MMRIFHKVKQLLLDEHEDAFFVSHNDVHFAIAIKIASGDLAANARVVVDLVGHQFGGAVFMAGSLEPVEHGGLFGTGVPSVMSIEAFAGNDVLYAVTINVGAGHGVGLAETNTIGVTFRLVGHDGMFYEGNFGTIPHLLIPSHTP